MSENRKLAAILAADVVGYSRLAGADEDRTLARLRALRSDLIDPTIAVHKGRVVKRTGDGAIVEFRSVVDAVRCAIEVQNGMVERNAGLPPERRIEFRIGIHLGDVVEESDGDLMGDGINIASRLEGVASPGTICLSEDAYRQVRARLDLAVSDLGETKLKNIVEPMRVYSLEVGLASKAKPATQAEPVVAVEPSAVLALPDRPSIAVLPFANMSGDAEQDYFADGMVEDIITGLSRIKWLFVIARNSSFAYKAMAVDIRTVARELGVRYVIEGSVRRAASRVRINVQLIEATTNSHLWAERFDRDLADFFVLQDEVVGRIVTALAEVLPSAAAVPRRRAASLEAYDLFVRGRVMVMDSCEANKTARALIRKAIEIDPDFAEAHAWLAINYWMGWAQLGGMMEPNRSLALTAARTAVALDPEDAGGHMILGYIRLYGGDWREAVSEFDAALRIDPNHADTWAMLTDRMVFEGKAAAAIDCVQKAPRLNPHPPGWYYWMLGFAEYAAGRYGDAVATLRREETYRSPSKRLLAASLVQLGRRDEAREEVSQILAATPNFSVEQWSRTQPFRDEAMRQHFIDGFIKAGLPA
jgi:adenylate cyclase